MRDETTGDDQDRYSGRTFAARYTDAAETATATRVATGKPYRSQRRLAAAGDRDDARVRAGPRDGRAEGRQGRRRRAHRLGARRRRSRACTPATGSRARPRCRRAATCSRATARRWRRGRTGPRRWARPRRRSSARSARSPTPTSRPRARLGYPTDAQVGITGLERAFDARLAGTPGGQLRAGARLLAERAPRKAAPVRTTIAPKVEEAAVDGAGRPLRRRRRAAPEDRRDPRRGGHRLLAACSLRARRSRSSPRPASCRTGSPSRPTRSRSRPRRRSRASSSATPTASRAAGRWRTRSRSRATACSRRWAPSSARRSSSRPRRRSASTSRPGSPARRPRRSRPRARSATTSRSARRAIGQGRVQATALQMAIVAATIGLRGRRPDVTLDPDRWKGRAPTHAATDARTAREVEKLMLGVVRYGTGTAADDPGRQGRGQDRHRRAEVDADLPAAVGRPTHRHAERHLHAQRAGRHERHRRLVLQLRAGRQRHAAHRGRRPARRRRRRRRHRRAGRPPGPPRRLENRLGAGCARIVVADGGRPSGAWGYVSAGPRQARRGGP